MPYSNNIKNLPATLAGSETTLLPRKSLILALFVLMAFLAYLPALGGQFLWDDSFLVGENPFFKSPIFFLEVFRHWLFIDSFSGYYRPIQNWSYMLDYFLWNQNPWGYHFSNVLLHALAAWLLYLVLQRVIQENSSFRHGDALAFLICALWVIHPIHNAAVAYISGRADTLAMIFVLSGWLLVWRGLSSHGGARIALFAAAWLLALAGILSKEIAIVWFLLITAILLGFSQKIAWKARAGICFGLLAAVGTCWLMRLDLPARIASPVVDNDLLTRCLMALRALGDYGSLIFWPADLHMERIIYQPEILAKADWKGWARFQWLTLAGVLVLLFFTLGMVRKGTGQRLRVLGVLWFMLGFIPISNLYPLNAQSAEHWIYMPSIGFILFVVSLVADFPPRWARLGLVTLSIAIVPLVLRTAARARDWTSPAKFYATTIQQGGGTWRIHLNLAVENLRNGKLDVSEKILRETWQHAPTPTIQITLGIVLSMENKMDEARPYLTFTPDEFRKVLKEYPCNWKAAIWIASNEAKAGNTTAALATLDVALSTRGDVWELIKAKANILQAAGRADAALALIGAYAQDNWWHYDSHMLWAKLLAQAGRTNDSLKEFGQAARLDIHAGEPFTQIAGLELAQKHFSDALAAATKAIARSGGLPGEYLQLARVYDAMGDAAKAQQAFEAARAMGGASQKASEMSNFL